MKSLWIGMKGSGKESLLQQLHPDVFVSHAPQSLMRYGDIIDSPAEYMENPWYFSALLITSYDVDLVVLVHRASESYNPYPCQFAAAFNRKTIGVVVDDSQDKMKDVLTGSRGAIHRAKSYLLYAGASEVYVGLDELLDHYIIK